MTEDFKHILIEKYPGQRQVNLLDMLLDIQDEYGYISKETIDFVSGYLRMPESRIFSITSFYPNFRFKSPGKYFIRICRGINCHIKHSAKLLNAAISVLKIQPGQSTRDGLFTLEAVNCLNSCSRTPAVTINGEYIDNVTEEKLIELITNYKNQHKNATA